MEAIILAAGLGTRLRPLTDRIPKALVEVDGVPMLERVARRVVAAGAHRLIINTHHLGQQIEDFVRARDGFGVEVLFSRETGAAPLDTGGGIQQAARLMELREPFIVHNSDVVTNLSLPNLLAAHDAEAVATLAVNRAETRSPLLLDDGGVVGVRFPTGTEQLARPVEGTLREGAFSGVSVVSPDLPRLMTDSGAFSVISVYLRLIAAGGRVEAYDIGDALWADIGTPERLEAATRLMAERRKRGAGAASAPVDDPGE